MINIIAMTAAAMLILVVGGFTGAVQVEKSIDYRGTAEGVIALASQDLECFDPNYDGIWTPCPVAPRCIATGACLTASGCEQSLSADPNPWVGGGTCYVGGITVPVGGITVAYQATLPDGSSLNVPVTFSFVSNSYNISATPPEHN
ncbi:MAG: hypothetical protein AAB091_00990 [Elusimicrobiota bacterium]